MEKRFTVDDHIGTLRPAFVRFPPWLLLITFGPILLLAVAILLASGASVISLFLSGCGLLGVSFWWVDRKSSTHAGYIKIFGKTGRVATVQTNGSEQAVELGKFIKIRIEKVVISGSHYGWLAVLVGDKGEAKVCLLTIRCRLIKRMTPIAAWLGIPIEVS